MSCAVGCLGKGKRGFISFLRWVKRENCNQRQQASGSDQDVSLLREQFLTGSIQVSERALFVPPSYANAME